MALVTQYRLNGNGYCSVGSEHLTVGSSVTFTTPGKVTEKCMNFPNSGNNYAYIRSNPIYDNYNHFSYSVWFKMTAHNSNQTFVYSRPGVGSGFALFYLTSYFRVNFKSSSDWSYTKELTDNVWYHLVLTYNGSTAKLYLNGVLESSKAITGFGKSYLVSNFLGIGASASGTQTPSSNMFNGKMNDIRFYDHVLSIKEIKELYKSCIVHYNFNVDDGTTVYDSSGHGNDAVIENESLEEAYLQNSGTTQYIDTEWYPDFSKNFEVEIECTLTDSAKRYCPISSYSCTNNVSFEINASNKARYWVNSDIIISDNSLSTTAKNTLVFGYNNGVCTLITNGTKKTVSRTFSGTSVKTALLFVDQSKRYSTFNTPIKIHRCRIKENGVIIKDFTPAIDQNDVYCMYEKVVGKYHYNGGTGVFTSNALNSTNYRFNPSIGKMYYHFNGTNLVYSKNVVPLLPTMTYNIWIRPTTMKGQFFLDHRSSSATNGVQPMYAYANGTIQTYSNTSPSGGTGSGVYFAKDTWSMITIVLTGGNCLRYKDGVLVEQLTCGVTETANPIAVGCRCTKATGTRLEGDVADLKVYTTALSANDILELYHNKATIADNGSFLCNTIIESDANSLKETSVMEVVDLNEEGNDNSNFSIGKTSGITSSELIET